MKFKKKNLMNDQRECCWRISSKTILLFCPPTSLSRFVLFQGRKWLHTFSFKFTYLKCWRLVSNIQKLHCAHKRRKGGTSPHNLGTESAAVDNKRSEMRWSWLFCKPQILLLGCVYINARRLFSIMFESVGQFLQNWEPSLQGLKELFQWLNKLPPINLAMSMQCSPCLSEIVCLDWSTSAGSVEASASCLLSMYEKLLAKSSNRVSGATYFSLLLKYHWCTSQFATSLN